MSLNVPDVDTILRPQLLVRAARCGLPHYRRERDLPRILGATSIPGPGRALHELIGREAQMNDNRRGGLSCYGIIEHVDVLTALLAEARIAHPNPRS